MVQESPTVWSRIKAWYQEGYNLFINFLLIPFKIISFFRFFIKRTKNFIIQNIKYKKQLKAYKKVKLRRLAEIYQIPYSVVKEYEENELFDILEKKVEYRLYWTP